MYNKILLASDGSAHAERAAKAAINLALPEKSSVTVLYVWDSSKSKKEIAVRNDADTLQEIRESRLAGTVQILERAGLSYSIELTEGEPGPAIVSFANARDFDILVMGSRGLNAFQEMVLGSVSHKAIKRVSCPILIVK
ncbi:universal stress protein [Planococcus lenghuensis]|uniref:Universal stress protein n=1 Tax=Planococcus lenghuensis TaxID=2213202 RepID=A0A1Q2L3U3_9BACL|nr:universal stress protein [Planococcus lenghuensis]AQQ54542.1 universal stress protein [Planococcus lenghuensis]